MLHIAKKYYQFCAIYGLPQLIYCPTGVTCSILVDHILASFPSRVSQERVHNVGWYDYQLIFCKSKIYTFKTGSAHKFINFRSLKNYKVDDYKKSLGQIVFRMCHIFRQRQCSYSDLFQKTMSSVFTKSLLIRLNDWKQIHEHFPDEIENIAFQILLPKTKVNTGCCYLLAAYPIQLSRNS